MSQTVPLERPVDAAIDTNKWDEFICWAAKFHSLPYFNEKERDYKVRAVEDRLIPARDAFLVGEDDWHTKLKHAFSYRPSMTHWTDHDSFLSWCKEEPQTSSEALRIVWNQDLQIPSRVQGFLEHIPREILSGASARLSIMSYLLLADGPSTSAVFKSSEFADGFRLTGYPEPVKGISDSDRFFHAMDFLDYVIEEAGDRGLVLRDRLDAQSVLRTITRWGPQDPWSKADRAAFNAYLKGTHIGAGVDGGDPEPTGVQGPPTPVETPPVELTLESLADRFMLPIEHLQRVERLLTDKKQAIFYGPPGTGKTYVARELAKYFARDGGRADIVQFHPSYAYEDFIEGLRPVEVEGETRFRVVDGPLKRIAERARERPEATHVLLIDEINRGNLSKVLGELYFLLEYRDEAITLQYSDDEFALPENLWIIGTMNTADRSIALVDAALRRRFFFVGFFPDEEPIDGLLRRWLGRHNPDYLWVADIVDEANRRLDDRHLAIGPSYFMKDNLDEEWLEIIWEHQVIPYLAEQFFGEEARLDDFHLKNLRRQPEIAVDETPDAVAE